MEDLYIRTTFYLTGKPTVDNSTTTDEINRLQGVVDRIISIGVTSSIDRNLLRQIAKAYQGSPRENRDFFTSVDFASLDALVPTIAQAACTTAAPIPGRHGNSYRSMLVYVLTYHHLFGSI